MSARDVRSMDFEGVFEVRGLRDRQLRLLRYFGVDLGAGESPKDATVH